jgi:hypothetical protein
MMLWLVQNMALYVGIVVVSLAKRGTIPILPRLTTAAWLVVAIRYLPWIHGMSQQIWSGKCGLRCATSWAAVSPWITLLAVPLASLFLWRGRDDVSSLLISLVSGNWLLFDVVGVHLACVRMGLWTCAVPLLGLLTLLTLGPYAWWKASRE